MDKVKLFQARNDVDKLEERANSWLSDKCEIIDIQKLKIIQSSIPNMGTIVTLMVHYCDKE